MEHYSSIFFKVCLALGLTAFGSLQAQAQNDCVEDMISGHFAGVQVLQDDGAPGAAISVRIRGLRSFRGESSPLYVLDGVVLNSPSVDADKTFWTDTQDYQALQNTLDGINPEDIENIEILKGATATSLYGSLGGNGVVLITTKHGNSECPKATWKSALTSTDQFNLGHRHHVSVGGGEKKSAYYLSAGFKDINGTVSGSKNNVATVNAKYDQKFGKTGVFGASLAFAMRNNDMTQAIAPLGSNSAVKAAWEVSPLRSEAADVWAQNYDDNSTQYSIIPHLYVRSGLGAGFGFEAQAGVDFRNKTRYRWVGSAIQRAADVEGRAGQTNATAARYNASAALKWGYDGNGHLIDIKAGAEYIGDIFSQYVYEGTTFFSQELRAPGISLATKVEPYRHVNTDNLNGAFFGTASYSYKGRYFIGAGLRAEKLYKYDSSFDELYPSANVAWDVAKEAFLEGQSTLNSLKFKAGWGKSGSRQILPYGYDYNYIAGVAPSFYTEGLTNYYDMVWKGLNTQIDLGVEFSMFSDRFGGSIDLYGIESEDNMAYWYHELKDAYQSIYSDKANVSNKGIEVALYGTPIKNGDVEWTLEGTFSYNSNEITNNGGADIFGHSVGILNGEELIVNANREGESVGSFYGYKSQGTVGKEHTLLTPAFQGIRPVIGDVKFIDQDGDGNVTEADRTIIGNSLPKFLAGFATTFKWKGLSLNAAFDGAFGHQVANLQKFYSDSNVNMGSALGVNYFSSRVLEDASYIRLANVSASYAFPMDNVRFIRSLTVTAAAKNILTFTNYSGSAPYVNCYGFDLSRLGVDNGAYPAFSSFLLGLALVF